MPHRWDLNVENMSREKLIENYFNAVHAVEELTETSDETILKLRNFFNIRPGIAVILNLLLSGRVISRQGAMIAIGHDEYDSYKVIQVYISILRKLFNGTEIKIKTFSGIGYQMPKSAIDIIKNLMENGERFVPIPAPCKKPTKWSKAEDAWLIQNYDYRDRIEIAAKLNRTENAICGRASQLKQRSIKTKSAAL